jgi:hypothetical protein
MQQSEKPTITLNEKSYIIEDLSDKAQYFVNQISDLQKQANEHKSKLDQVTVAEKGFINLLQEEVEGAYEEVPEDTV